MTRKLLSLLVAIVMVMTAIPFAMAEDAPMKITVAGYMFGPIDDTKDVITPAVEKMLLEKHGINVDIVVEYIEYSDYSDILAPRLVPDADGNNNAPDVFLALNKLDTYYDQGVIASWDIDFFKENAPDVWNFIEAGCVNGELASQFDLWLENATKDGKMVVVPSLKPDGSMPYKTLIYRGDWLENLGVSEDELPKTVDEFVELMTRFAKEDPDQDGEDDTYGFSITAMKALFGAYGMYNGFINGESYWYEEDGELINADVSPKSKTVLELLRDLYADGVIDPEFVKGSERAEGQYWAASVGLINGLYGASANASIDHYRLKGVTGPNDEGGPVAITYWEVNGPDAKFVYAPWPAGPDGDYGWAIDYAVAVSESAVYNKMLENDPEKLATIFKIMNAFATDDELYMLASWGIKGEHYTDENGVLERTMENAALNEVGVWGCRSLYGADRAYSELAYNLAFYNSPAIANRYKYFVLPQYDSYILNAVSTTLPSAQGTLMTDLQTLRDEAYIAFIRGEKSLDEWDAYVDEYMKAGGQTLYDEANEWFANK